MTRRLGIALTMALLLAVGLRALDGQTAGNTATVPGLRFAISFPAARSAQPLDGRIILVVSNNDKQEPRFQNNVYNPKTQLSFGIDVNALKPGQDAIIDGRTAGYPLESLAQIPPGDYWVQAVLHKYETFHRGDGHTVKMPMDRGEGQHWNRAPGNLLNAPVKVHIDPRTNEVIRISLDTEIPPLPEPKDTALRQVREDPEPEPDEVLGPSDVPGRHRRSSRGIRQAPRRPVPADDQPRALSARVSRFSAGARPRPRAGGRAAAQFFTDWTGPGFPRMIMLLIQHANPFYDDSYAVNSENVGPYGDAINEELIPYIEKRFRADRRGLGARPLRWIDRGLGGARLADLLSRQLQRRVGRLPRLDRLPPVRDHQHLRREERVLHRQRLEEDAAPGRPKLSRPPTGDRRRGRPLGAGAGHEDAIG